MWRVVPDAEFVLARRAPRGRGRIAATAVQRKDEIKHAAILRLAADKPWLPCREILFRAVNCGPPTALASLWRWVAGLLPCREREATVAISRESRP